MEADHDGAICDKENAQLDTSVFIQAVAVLPGSASTGVCLLSTRAQTHV